MKMNLASARHCTRVVTNINHRYHETNSDLLEHKCGLMNELTWPCHGYRLSPQALSVRLAAKTAHIGEIPDLSCRSSGPVGPSFVTESG